MDRRILIEDLFGYKRMAVVEDGILAEYAVEKDEDTRAAGNIYKGIVRDILTGIGAAFVNIGPDKNAYLPLEEAGLSRGAVLRRGQDVVVQITKEAVGEKGPRVTAMVNIPGSLMVYMPFDSHIAVSGKITAKDERDRLIRLVRKHIPSGRGAIVRTAAEGADEENIAGESERLAARWEAIERRAAYESAPVCLLDDSALECRAVRDLLSGEAVLITDDAGVYESARAYARAYAPERADAVRFDKDACLFEDHHIDAMVKNAFKRKISLPSGGSIVIDRTEALTAIDVNSGSFVGGKTLEDTVFRVNLEAAEEIARQMRLRDIGGIIVVDFIDMESPEHEQQVLECLKKASLADRMRIRFSGFSELGLLEISRSRLRRGPSLEMRRECPMCMGSGMIEEREALAAQVLRRIWARRRRGEECVFLVTAAPDLCGDITQMAAGYSLNAYLYPDKTRRGSEYDISPAMLSDLPQRAVPIGKEKP